MDKRFQKPTVTYGDWGKSSYKNKLLGIDSSYPDSIMYTSTSASSGTSNLNYKPCMYGYGLGKKCKGQCTCKGTHVLQKAYRAFPTSSFTVEGVVSANQIKQVKRLSSAIQGMCKDPNALLPNGTIPVPPISGVRSLVPTYYEESSISMDIKSPMFGFKGMNKIESIISLVSRSDKCSDNTPNSSLKTFEVMSLNEDLQAGVIPLKKVQCLLCSDTSKHDLVISLYNPWIVNDIGPKKHYLSDEFPALPGQADPVPTIPFLNGCGHIEAINGSQPSNTWSCVETYALLETAASTLRSTENSLISLIEKITPSESCRANKTYLFQALKRFLISCLGKNTKVYMAGSTAYDIDIDYGQFFSPLFQSDIDIEVISQKYGYNSRAILRKVYHDLCEMQATLKEVGLAHNWVIGDSNFKLVDSARVPIIIMKTRNAVLCDISANTSNSLSHNELFMRYIEKHPILRKFMRLMKHWLKFRGIPVMKEGGMPSILWMLLFCNVVDTDMYPGTLSNDPKSTTASMFELLVSKNMMGIATSNPTNGNVETEGLMYNITILASLEKCFKVLSHGTNFIEMVSVFTLRGFSKCAGKALKNSHWYIGDICGSLMSHIEMEPNVPFGTWLVYYYEIQRVEKRASKYTKYIELLISLIVCLRVHAVLTSSGTKSLYIEQLKALVANVKKLMGYDLDHLVQEGKNPDDILEEHVKYISEALNLPLGFTRTLENSHQLVNYIINKFPSLIMDIFKCSFDRVYTIPAAIEPPLPLILSQDNNDCKDKFSATPVTDGTMWNDSGWFIVALGFKLYIIKAIKVCVDWETWWSMDFVSRRDSKTVYHGFIYRQLCVYSEKDDENIDDDPFMGASDKPSVLMRRGGLILFHPCDIVSRLYVMKVIKDEPRINLSYYSHDIFTGAKTLYVLPGFEAKRFRKIERTAAKMSKTIGNYVFPCIPRPRSCHHCGAITVTETLKPNDNRPAYRKIKSLRYVLSSPWYLEHYRRMKASLMRVETKFNSINI